MLENNRENEELIDVKDRILEILQGKPHLRWNLVVNDPTIERGDKRRDTIILGNQEPLELIKDMVFSIAATAQTFNVGHDQIKDLVMALFDRACEYVESESAQSTHSVTNVETGEVIIRDGKRPN